MKLYYSVKGLLWSVLIIALLVLFIKTCTGARDARVIRHHDVQNHVIIYKDKQGDSHGQIGVTDMKEAPREVVKTGKAIAGSKKKVESVTSIGLVYPCDSSATYVIPDSLLEKWSREGIPDTVRIQLPPRSVEDSLTIVKYWHKRMLMIDVESANGTIRSVKSHAVLKRPRIAAGPSITASFYRGNIIAIPGVSIVYDILPRRKR